MVSETPLETHVSGIRLSSVVPSEMTGGDKDRELTNMDLALKLHYVRGVWFFNNEAVQGLTIYDLKEPMFPWLALYPTASGRIRRSESGRPFIKCNDGGVRIVEAHSDKTVEEWLSMMNAHDCSSHDHHLAYDQILGPDLGFSPLVFIQFTWFTCGGMSVGLSWAHVLGDPFSASSFINMWGKILQGHSPSKSIYGFNPERSQYSLSTQPKPVSLKQVDPVGDSWLVADDCKMETHSFHFSAKQLDNILADIRGVNRTNQPGSKISRFDVITAIIWKSVSKINEDSGPSVATICTRNSHVRDHEVPSNGMVFSIVRADFLVAKGDVHEIAEMIAEKQEEENGLIEETVESDRGESDYTVYGANLTFVNLEEANIYGLELKGQKPTFASYSIKGVGDRGVVLVQPGPEDGCSTGKGSGGRTVTVTLPQKEFTGLTNELGAAWGLA